jgi:hypothetical protein
MTKETYTGKAKQSKSEVWLITSGIVLVPVAAALAVVVQMLQ